MLFFESESERRSFEEYVDYNKADLKKRVDKSDSYDHIVTENETKIKGYKAALRTAIVLKEMLEEFRTLDKQLKD